MSKLMESLDAYKDFNIRACFISNFDCYPSTLELEVPLEDNKQNMKRVLDALNLSKYEVVPLFKRWSTKDDKNADAEKDYPNRYVFTSEKKPLMLAVNGYNEDILVEFFYDHKDSELEQWVLETNHKLRTTFGEEVAPSFKILTFENNCFMTEDIKTRKAENLQLDQLYNDDFKEVDQIIARSMGEQRSGLILFHGLPGTGKTTYIKDLIGRFVKKDFIFIQNEFVKDLLKPQFVSFLMSNRNSVLVIEDAERVITSREYNSEGSVVSTILQLTDGLFSDYLNIKVICTFNTSIEKIDKALLRKGRLIAKYEFKPLSTAKTISLLKSLGHEPREKEMPLAEIFNLHNKDFEERKRKAIGFR